MDELRFCLFETSIGPCGLAWNEGGQVAAVQLAEESHSASRFGLVRRYPKAIESAPPQVVEDAIHRIQALLGGIPTNLCCIQVDMSRIAPFNRRVYEVARAIAPGRTSTYGAIAEALGDRAAARAVGVALGQNPIPIIVPCHRVLGAGGKLGGFSAPGGVATKRRLLAIENARRSDEPTLFDIAIDGSPVNRSPEFGGQRRGERAAPLHMDAVQTEPG